MKKLREVRQEDIPDINNPNIRFPVLEGDKLINEVLKGGYNVHPVPPPNSDINDRIRNRYVLSSTFGAAVNRLTTWNG